MTIELHCPHCGCDGTYQDEDEAIDNGWRQFDGEWRCNDCWCYCDDCDEIYKEEDTAYIEHLDRTVCDGCINDHYNKCDRCDDYYDNDDCNGPEEVAFMDENGNISHVQYLCEECRRQANAYWDDDREVYIINTNRENTTVDGHIYQPNLDMSLRQECRDCRELGRTCPKCLRKQAEALEKEETILWVYDTRFKSYHHSDHNHFKETKYRDKHEHPYLYYGIELEVLFNCNVPTDQITKEFIVATNGLFVAEADRSVSDMGNGAEFISRPLSYKMWMDESTKRLLDKGMEVLKKYRAFDPQPNGCGLHVHMSRRFFEENTEKKVKDIKADIDWMFQVFQPEMEKISQRKYTRYCASKAFRLKEALKMSNYGFNLNPRVTLEKSGLTQSRGSGDTHHDAIIETFRTIEVRTFNSTVRTNEILATIEFCRAIAHASRNMKMTKDTSLGDILFCKDSNYLPDFIKKQKVDTTAKFANKLEVKL